MNHERCPRMSLRGPRGAHRIMPLWFSTGGFRPGPVLVRSRTSLINPRVKHYSLASPWRQDTIHRACPASLATGASWVPVCIPVLPARHNLAPSTVAFQAMLNTLFKLKIASH